MHRGILSCWGNRTKALVAIQTIPVVGCIIV